MEIENEEELGKSGQRLAALMNACYWLVGDKGEQSRAVGHVLRLGRAVADAEQFIDQSWAKGHKEEASMGTLGVLLRAETTEEKDSGGGGT